jgi:hypothetical protein
VRFARFSDLAHEFVKSLSRIHFSEADGEYFTADDDVGTGFLIAQEREKIGNGPEGGIEIASAEQIQRKVVVGVGDRVDADTRIFEPYRSQFRRALRKVILKRRGPGLG